MSDAGFDRFHELVGDVPVLGTATEEEKTAYTAKLLEGETFFNLPMVSLMRP